MWRLIRLSASAASESIFTQYRGDPENDEVWITLKDVGKTQVFGAKPPFEQKALLNTGPITNHVNFATIATASLPT